MNRMTRRENLLTAMRGGMPEWIPIVPKYTDIEKNSSETTGSSWD